MKEYQIWIEGYRVQGNESDASLQGTVEAESFDEACIKLLGDQLDKNKDGSYHRGPYRPSGPLGYIPPGLDRLKAIQRGGNFTVWQCQLFDNEADARKSFG